MGIGINYTKPGKGVPENEPEKKGIRRYFELLWRHLWLLTKANVLYFVVSLPFLAVYYFGTVWICTQVFQVRDSFQITLMITFLIFILYGSGPVSCGYTYILRNCAESRHVFLWSDFFEKIKENFWFGMGLFVSDAVCLLVCAVATGFYHNLFVQGNALGMILNFVVVLLLALYTLMHFYVYQIRITFENKPMRTIRIAFATALAFVPAGGVYLILATAVIIVLFYVFAPILLLFFFGIIGIGLMRFPIEFYVARKIRKTFIDTKQ